MSEWKESEASFEKGTVEILNFAIRHHLKELGILPLFGRMINATRKNDKKPALVFMTVPDEWVKNINGRGENQDIYCLIRIPRILKKRMESPIITPEEAASGRR